MSNEMVKTGSAPDMNAIEQVLVQGDLSKLTPAQRVTYYNRVCESIGVNPLTRPFEYIVLNGKLTLYARKDCTDQLRSNGKISIAIVSKEKIDDVYVVTAKARTPDGREDEATGAVNLAGKRGDDLANALMKAETKAKRRVTMSICGLGFTDESEIESIPTARRVQVDMTTGEVVDAIAEAAAESSPDFAAAIEAADSPEALAAVAREIESARKANKIGAEARAALGKVYKAKSASFANGAAA